MAALEGVAAGSLKEDLVRARAASARAQERQGALSVTSPADGVFLLPQAQDLPGRFVRQGDLLGYILTTDRPTIRVVVNQTDIGLIVQRTKAVKVRLASRMESPIPAAIQRIVPGAQDRLPGTVLATVEGGGIPIDPRDQQGLKTFENLFEVDLEALEPAGPLCLGGRAYGRFNHGFLPLGWQ